MNFLVLICEISIDSVAYPVAVSYLYIMKGIGASGFMLGFCCSIREEE